MILGKFAVQAAGQQRIGTTKRRESARKSSRQIRVHWCLFVVNSAGLPADWNHEPTRIDTKEFAANSCPLVSVRG